MVLPERLRVVPMMAVMGTIFFLSHQPGSSVDISLFPGMDKAAHFFVYGLLAAAAIYAHSRERRLENPVKAAATAVAVALLYGVTDEFHQSFVPGRFVSGADVAADFLGGLFAALFWLHRLRLRRVR